MGWRELVGRVRGEVWVDGSRALVLRDAAFAAGLQQPTEPGLETTGPCDNCGKPLLPHVITTGSEAGDPEVWDAAPVAVDGWACMRCGTVRYPRTLSANESVRYGERGVEAVRAHRWREAEWWFTRIAWAWPGYAAAHLDLGSALRDRVRAGFDTTLLGRNRTRRRAQAAYDAAVAAGEREADRTPVRLRAMAYLGAAELAAEDQAIDRALRAIDGLRALPGVEASVLSAADDVEHFIVEERWIFGEASAVLGPHLNLQGRPAVPIEEGATRDACTRAIEQLEAYYQAHPAHWQSVWFEAMGRAAIGERERALATWRRAAATHPSCPEIVREASLALLRAKENDAARALNCDATQRHPRDAALWANRAVTELLCGDLASAIRCADESLRLDPEDRITHALRRRLGELRPEGPLPRTLAELERRR